MLLIILTFVFHLFCGAIISFCMFLPKIREKDFDQNKPHLTDLNFDNYIDGHIDIYLQQKYVDDVIIPYSEYSGLIKKIETSLANTTWLFSAIAWLIVNAISYIVTVRKEFPDINGVACTLIICAMTVGNAFLSHLFAQLLTKKYPIDSFVYDYASCYKQYKDSNCRPAFPITDERQVYNNLYKLHYAYLLQIESDISSKVKTSKVFGTIYLIALCWIIWFRQ